MGTAIWLIYVIAFHKFYQNFCTQKYLQILFTLLTHTTYIHQKNTQNYVELVTSITEDSTQF